MALHKKTIAVDLDGVLLEYDGWKGEHHFGKPIEGAAEAMAKLMLAGWNIVIFTTRVNPTVHPDYTQEQLIEMVAEALDAADIVYDSISPYKPLARIYLDDRALHFHKEIAEGGMAWSKALKDIEA